MEIALAGEVNRQVAGEMTVKNNNCAEETADILLMRLRWPWHLPKHRCLSPDFDISPMPLMRSMMTK